VQAIPLGILPQLKLDYLWAALCMLGAVYFMFRDGAGAP
jgi:uncharacterized protein (DUF486 family)